MIATSLGKFQILKISSFITVLFFSFLALAEKPNATNPTLEKLDKTLQGIHVFIEEEHRNMKKYEAEINKINKNISNLQSSYKNPHENYVKKYAQHIQTHLEDLESSQKNIAYDKEKWIESYISLYLLAEAALNAKTQTDQTPFDINKVYTSPSIKAFWLDIENTKKSFLRNTKNQKDINSVFKEYDLSYKKYQKAYKTYHNSKDKKQLEIHLKYLKRTYIYLEIYFHSIPYYIDYIKKLTNFILTPSSDSLGAPKKP